MGGIAFRAPVLASIFLIVSLATLAMPGSSNFVGEFLILLGVFKAKLVIAIIAFSGVVMASVYALRLFIRAMHNRVGAEGRLPRDHPARRRRARAAGARDPVHGDLPAAGAEAQRNGDQAAVASAHAALNPAFPTSASTHPMIPLATATLKGPHVDFAGLSPLIALLGGAVVVLLVGLLGSRRARSAARPRAQPRRARRGGRA